MANPPRSSCLPAPLAHRPFPELAEALRFKTDEIVRLWITRLREELPGIGHLADSELQDNVPAILAGLADALAGSDWSTLERESPEQGLKRYRQDYNIRALMHEDRLLRQRTVEQVEAHLGRRTTQDEATALHTGIDIMLQQAVTAFVDLQSGHLRDSAESEIKYLSFLSHDLNNNLGTVTLFLQLLHSRLVNFPEFAEDVATLHTAQEAILNTIGGMARLLQSERLRKSGIVAKAAPLHLQRVVTVLCQQLRPRAEQKGLRLFCEAPANVIINSDAELITLALQNLLGNAVKYSTKGAVRVIAKLRKEDGDGEGGRWMLIVQDEGPGIAKDQLGKIFDAFKRGDTHGQMGVGLGLAIVSQAAKLLGAELTVESAVGIGTKFRLLLPTEGESARKAGGGARDWWPMNHRYALPTQTRSSPFQQR